MEMWNYRYELIVENEMCSEKQLVSVLLFFIERTEMWVFNHLVDNKTRLNEHIAN